MRAILVSVEYTDYLRITLPWNRHHFSEVWIVTSPGDAKNVYPVAGKCGAYVVVTDLFYADGARFNKFRALEHGLDCMGRTGWITLMDADVLWPRDVGMYEQYETIKWLPVSNVGPAIYQDPGMIVAPLRRMVEGQALADLAAVGVPDESAWREYPLHPQQHEWAGYSQTFHATDPALGTPPWHETNFTSAGTADSLFQAKWPRERKIRPPFEVLHLGGAGQNWMGRATPLLDGTTLSSSQERRDALQDLFLKRRGKVGMARFDHEKLAEPPQ